MPLEVTLENLYVHVKPNRQPRKIQHGAGVDPFEVGRGPQNQRFFEKRKWFSTLI